MTDHPRPASLARRALPALAVLGASGAILTQLGGASEAATQTTTAGTGTAAAPSGAAKATATTTTLPAAPTTTVRGRTGASTAPTTIAPTTTAPAASSSATACTGETYTGAAFANKYGSVQVAAVVSSAGKLCDVQVLAYPDGDRKSVSINQRALPTLRTEALAANSASIQAVTGATLTSNGYKSSLQSALDQAR